MDIRQLRYFLTIVEEGSITKAAAKLHIAQPPLSHQLKLLEEELEIKLIERNTRKIQITDAGRILQYRSKQILELAENTRQELKDLKEGFKGVLSLGTVPSSSTTILLNKLNEFHNKYPHVNFKIRESNTSEILKLLSIGTIEVGIILTPFNSEKFESLLLPSEPMMVAVKSNMYFSSTETSVDLNDLINKPLIIDNKFKDMLITSCQQAGFEPTILCENEDARAVLLWVNAGIGIGIVPKSAANLIPSLNLKYIEINELSLKTNPAVVWLKNRYLSDVVKNFIDIFKSV
ncbi:DNA-binding transcriptional regulator, LysR family [Clostridium acidisoli DSM 12555]|uniref:DNA-binding transcriptional regulator, LysR family n=1 Tax=Clostridium acidisoli DSM 12555 TaxID=1121291 RepID=A0A1W1WWQ9_9CLOT|nr:LysR family transcriptional regulator [Clostridium acidisoli]SMC16037.1 DNA-binding transcriptional regulator, LysR family [Clostridium acidisoli DSM 12555]